MFVVIGTSTVDLLISGLDRIPRLEGDEFTASSLAFCEQPLLKVLGGNGANSAYVLATLGAPVALVSACGQDDMGQDIARWLQQRGVDLRFFLRHAELATATSTIITDSASNRLTFHHAGASQGLDGESVSQKVVQAATTLLITGYTVMPELRRWGYGQLLAAAKKAGAVTALDIGPAIQPPAKLEELRPILPAVDYLLSNEYELEICVGSDNLEENAARILATGARCLIVKRGSEGASAWRRGTERLDVRGFSVEANFTVGAGDTFNAGLLFALGNGMPLPTALAFANATAALTVKTRRGVLDAPTRNEVDEFLRVH